MIWFTADLHLGCKKLVQYSRTQFATVDEHDDHVLDGINHWVQPSDILVIAGDFCREKPGRYRPRIKCKHIHFILGNHDKETKIRAVFGGNVWHSRMMKTTDRPRQKVWVSHYPPCFWPESHYGSMALYGHIHDNAVMEDMMDVGMPGRKSMDIGVDAAYRLFGEYRPFSEEDMLSIIGHRPGHEELWKEIPGYKSYEVSTLGNLRSIGRMIHSKEAKSYWKKGQCLKPATDNDGYQVIRLSKDGQQKMHKIHRLVLEAFRGPNDQQVLHGPAGKGANWLSNLSYGTGKQNWEDRRRDGTDLCKPVLRSDGKKYASLTEAAADNDCLVGSISNACRRNCQANGFSWQYHQKVEQ